MEKPDVITRDDVFFDYYFTRLIEEQKKTNKLLEQLLGEGVTENVERNISKTRRERKLG